MRNSDNPKEYLPEKKEIHGDSKLFVQPLVFKNRKQHLLDRFIKKIKWRFNKLNFLYVLQIRW